MNPKTLAFGQLEEDGDTWFLVRPSGILLLDAAFTDNALEHQQVSVAGEFGFPPSNPTVEKLIVDRVATHAAIEKHAYSLYVSGVAGSPVEHWLQAERELLHLD